MTRVTFRRFLAALVLVYAANFLWLVHITATCPICQGSREVDSHE